MHIEHSTIKNYPLTIVLPTGYDEKKHYPTIYLQDGGNGALQVLNSLDHLIRSQQIQPVILVGVTPLDRNADYTPWKTPALLPDKPDLEGKAKNYLDILVHDIKPYIDQHYATNPSPSQTVIGGCSLGGLLSYFASYYYPSIFHRYILLSASFWLADVVNFAAGQSVIHSGQTYQKPVVARNQHFFYCYVGEIEGQYRQHAQKEMTQHTRFVVDSLKSEGLSEEQLRFDINPLGTHDAYFFSAYFLQALHWLFPMNPSRQESLPFPLPRI